MNGLRLTEVCPNRSGSRNESRHRTNRNSNRLNLLTQQDHTKKREQNGRRNSHSTTGLLAAHRCYAGLSVHRLRDEFCAMWPRSVENHPGTRAKLREYSVYHVI